MINQDEAYNLMVKKLASEISSEENLQLEEWLAASGANLKTYIDLKQIWNSVEREDLEIDIDAAWARVNKRTATKIFRINTAFALKIAAAFIAVALLGILAYHQLTGTETSVSTAANEIKQITLPDGSQVWLHEYSSLTYKNNLEGSKREVELQGLAFFDVKRDEQHAFVIETPKGSVEVLGTSFEVSAYKNDSMERVTVSTGKVKFANTETGKHVLLTRDMQGELSKSGYERVKDVDAASLVSWQSSKLVFNNESMEQVAEKLERYYHIQVKFKTEAVKLCRFTGTFEKATLNEVLDVIGKALQLTYVKESNRVTINGQGCKAQ